MKQNETILEPLTFETIERADDASIKAMESLKGTDTTKLTDKELFDRMIRYYQ